MGAMNFTATNRLIVSFLNLNYEILTYEQTKTAYIIYYFLIRITRILKPSYCYECHQKLFDFFFLLDIDECETDTDNCDVNAHCNNTKGSFQCTCNIGYFGDGVVCEGT